MSFVMFEKVLVNIRKKIYLFQNLKKIIINKNKSLKNAGFSRLLEPFQYARFPR